ncbi:MAG: corrinoid protein [Deltaproteobacteria bacterium]|nr:corrinoid protein [Deltaproteobacteria bacterium]
MNALLNTIKEAVISKKRKEIEGLVDQAIEAGIEPGLIINDGLIAAMDVVGEQFSASEIFVPEMLASALTMKMGLEKVKPLLTSSNQPSRGTVLMGTVKGDMHDIGKNIVNMMLEGAGFTVVDLGVDLTVEKLISEIETLKPDLLGLSALLTTVMPEMERAVRELGEKGLRKNMKIMVGGAPVSKAFADKIGADGHGGDAAEAVELAKRLVSK